MVVAVYDWGGFYIGANGGGGWSHKCWDHRSGGWRCLACRRLPRFARSGIVGGQIGYHWQASNWVFGLEAQCNWADIRGACQQQFFGCPDLTQLQQPRRCVRPVHRPGRLRLEQRPVLREGRRRGDRQPLSAASRIGHRHAGLRTTSTDTRWGGTVGAGLEYGFAPNWIVGVEYDHIFLDDQDLPPPHQRPPASSLSTVSTAIRQDVDLATVRLNYRFGGPVVAQVLIFAFRNANYESPGVSRGFFIGVRRTARPIPPSP